MFSLHSKSLRATIALKRLLTKSERVAKSWDRERDSITDDQTRYQGTLFSCGELKNGRDQTFLIRKREQSRPYWWTNISAGGGLSRSN